MTNAPAGLAAGTGAALQPGGQNIQLATGTGGVSGQILDETGQPVLDEAGQPVLDEGGLHVVLAAAAGGYPARYGAVYGALPPMTTTALTQPGGAAFRRQWRKRQSPFIPVFVSLPVSAGLATAAGTANPAPVAGPRVTGFSSVPGLAVPGLFTPGETGLSQTSALAATATAAGAALSPGIVTVTVVLKAIGVTAGITTGTLAAGATAGTLVTGPTRIVPHIALPGTTAGSIAVRPVTGEGGP